MKIYPHSGDEKKKKKKKGDAPEKKSNLQITDRGVVAVQQFNLDIADQEFIVLVGPSGCGKSTTLRMVAGLEEISEGQLLIDGKVMNDVAPKDRDIAMVFQSYALYPHMTVYENMAFSLKLKKVPKDEIDRKVKEAAEILDITQYIVIMRDGFIQQIGPPQQVFDHPANLFVAGFIGTPQMNFFDAKLEKDGSGYYVTVAGARMELPADKQDALKKKNAAPQDITLGIRPDHITLCDASAPHALSATVDVTELMGATIHMHVNVAGKDAIIILPTIDLTGEQKNLTYGAKINVTFGGNVVHLFSKADEKSLL